MMPRPPLESSNSLLTIWLATITLTLATPGCLRHECTLTDATCKPEALLLWLQSLTAPLPTNGRVASFQKISSTQGGLTGPLADGAKFGQPAVIGDLDADSVTDLAVGAIEDGGEGAVYVLFMNPNGTVKAEQKISSTQGGFTGPLGAGDQFGIGVASPGDIDGDGTPDLAVGAHLGNDGGGNRGAVYVLFLNANGTVKSEQLISSSQGGLIGPLGNNDRFGFHIAAPGDIDGDGVPDLVASAGGDGDGGNNRGAVYVLFLNANGTVKAEQKISSTQGGLTGPLNDNDLFSVAAAPGDIDNDGVGDLVVGAYADDDDGTNRGAAYVLFLNANGTVRAEQKISSSQGGLSGPLEDNDQFGRNMTSAGDLNLDGVPDLFAGAFGDDDGGATTTSDRGALYVLFLNANGTVQSEQKISGTAGGFTGTLDDDDEFCRPAAIGDLNGDRVPDLIVGAAGDDDGGLDRGAAYVLFLERQ